MVTLLKREFTVALPLRKAWDHLARIVEWPSWARHIKKVELEPPGDLAPTSTGVIHLVNGMKPAFRVTEFNLGRNWKWVGPFLWVTVIYDHQFVAIDGDHTRLIWVVEAEGFGASTLGRLFAKVYRRDLDKAIPLLVAEMENSRLESTAEV
jgi:hypothetical protein